MSTWKVQAKYFDPETREWQEDTFIESGYSTGGGPIYQVERKIRNIGGERVLIKSCVEINV